MNRLARLPVSALHTANFPNPVSHAPPGAGGLLELLGYVAWGFTLLCVAAFIVAAGKMAVSHHRGEPVGQGLLMVLIAAVVGSSAGPILTAVTRG